MPRAIWLYCVDLVTSRNTWETLAEPLKFFNEVWAAGPDLGYRWAPVARRVTADGIGQVDALCGDVGHVAEEPEEMTTRPHEGLALKILFLARRKSDKADAPRCSPATDDVFPATGQGRTEIAVRRGWHWLFLYARRKPSYAHRGDHQVVYPLFRCQGTEVVPFRIAV